MKKIISVLFLFAALIVASAQVPNYTLQTVALGTNTIPANNLTVLPITLATTIQTNPGTQAVWYWATNSSTNFVRFTLPVTNNLYFTNTFIESNTVVGLGTKTWTVAEPVSFTNNASYKVTNAAYVTSYYSTNTTTNVVLGVTNIYTWRTNLVYVTNSATITTNYQVFNTSALVPFTITGTDYTTVTNVSKGASALDVSKSATVAAVLSFKLMGAGTSPVGFGWHLTTDGSLTNTLAANQLTIAANGTTVVTTNINLSVGPFGYLNVVYLTNGNATIVTNLTLKVAQKVSAP